MAKHIKVVFPDVDCYNTLPFLKEVSPPPSGSMPYVIKERSSWVWQGEPLYWVKDDWVKDYWIEDVGVEDEHKEIPIDEFRDSEDKD